MLISKESTALKNHIGKCDLCASRFSLVGDLTVHKNANNSNRHECNICRKSFTQRIHSGDTFECQICAREYPEMSSLLKHEKIHL